MLPSDMQRAEIEGGEALFESDGAEGRQTEQVFDDPFTE